MTATDGLSIEPLDGSARALRAAEERAQERARMLEHQSSPRYTPAERIDLWERLHMLSLPRAAAHPLVKLIAAQTGLTTRQVMDEQQRRHVIPAEAQS